MHEVRIMVRVSAVGAKPDLSLLFVDSLAFADHVLAFGDRVLDVTGFRVNQIEVPPAVALRYENDLIGPGQKCDLIESHEVEMRRPDERVRLLVDEGASGGGLGVDLGQPETL